MPDEKPAPIAISKINIGPNQVWEAVSRAEKKLSEDPARLAAFVLSARTPGFMEHQARQDIAHELEDLLRDWFPQSPFEFTREVATWMTEREVDYPSVVRITITAEPYL